MKTFILRRTQRGGAAGNGGIKGKTTPKNETNTQGFAKSLIQYCQRRWLYYLGDTTVQTCETGWLSNKLKEIRSKEFPETVVIEDYQDIDDLDL